MQRSAHTGVNSSGTPVTSQRGAMPMWVLASSQVLTSSIAYISGICPEKAWYWALSRAGSSAETDMNARILAMGPFGGMVRFFRSLGGAGRPGWGTVPPLDRPWPAEMKARRGAAPACARVRARYGGSARSRRGARVGYDGRPPAGTSP